jgi:hypothetical protein
MKKKTTFGLDGHQVIEKTKEMVSLEHWMLLQNRKASSSFKISFNTIEIPERKNTVIFGHIYPLSTFYRQWS